MPYTETKSYLTSVTGFHGPAVWKAVFSRFGELSLGAAVEYSETISENKVSEAKNLIFIGKRFS